MMRRLTSIVARPVVSAGAAAVLVCGLSAGTALAVGSAAAGQHPTATAVATVTWHRLALRNGWRSSRSASYSVANPSYTVSGGIVYLDGALHQATGSKTEFAVLPRGARPAHKEFMTVMSGTAAGVPGTVEISPDGVMTASSPTGSTRPLTSLEAVSYPAAGGHWTNIKLAGGWKSAAAAFGTVRPAYTIRNGIVYLGGSLTSGTGSRFATLAKNARPRSVLYITVYNSGGSWGDVVIPPSGVIESFGLTAHLQTALDGVSFPTAAAKLGWHKLKLSAGWTSSQADYQTGDPAYAVSGPIVYLAGSMHFTSGSAIFAALPKAARPVNDIIRQVYTYGDTTGGLILTPIFGIAGSNPPSNAQGYTSLAGIAYPRNS
jgi:hypothetical protein